MIDVEAKIPAAKVTGPRNPEETETRTRLRSKNVPSSLQNLVSGKLIADLAGDGKWLTDSRSGSFVVVFKRTSQCWGFLLAPTFRETVHNRNYKIILP